LATPECERKVLYSRPLGHCDVCYLYVVSVRKMYDFGFYAPCSNPGQSHSCLSRHLRSCCGMYLPGRRGQLKYNGTRAETRFRLSAKWTSPFKSTGASVQSTAGSRGVCISGSNTGYTMFRGSVKSTGHPLHSPVSPSLPLQCITVCHHISTGVYCRCYILVAE
jgi:hypothetical protein